MRRKSFSKSDAAEESLINLTPLIDVVFVVLIVFILVAPLVDLDRIELASSSPGKKAESAFQEESGDVTIHAYADNTVRLNHKQVDIIELEMALKKLHGKNPQAIPKLFQDKKAFFGTYQQIKNALEIAGYEKLDVILDSN
ncbi:MAG: biopolymer transporter ExbD [Simkaniaceae bacterium]